MKGLGEIQKIFRDADDALFSNQLNVGDYTKRVDSEVRQRSRSPTHSPRVASGTARKHGTRQ